MGFDGTKVNTGNKNVILKKMEDKIGKKVYWIVSIINFKNV